MEKNILKKKKKKIITYIKCYLFSKRIKSYNVLNLLRLDGKHFDQDDDIFLCLCYNVPEGSSRQGLIDDADIFDRISDHVLHIQNTTNNKCKFLISGDFNARTATYADYVEDDSSEHVHVLPDDYQTDAHLHQGCKNAGKYAYFPCHWYLPAFMAFMANMVANMAYMVYMVNSMDSYQI